MDYKAYKIFDSDNFIQLTQDIQVAQCMKMNTDSISQEEVEMQALSKLEDLSVSERLVCSFCKAKFEDQVQQRLHYKLDWHRYNLKRNLAGLRPVTEEKFSQLADLDDVSSISGSESDSDEEAEDEENADKNGKVRKSSSKTSAMDRELRSQLALQASRHAKVFFENSSGKIISLYRCVLHGKKDTQEKDKELISLALNCSENCTWAVIMLGGGHFAAGVFKGLEAVVHKTFHCYTVRARQGGAQSACDGRSSGGHPKSAGASLRRYNEAALVQHVQEIFVSWEGHIKDCGLIFYRAVGHNRNVLFGGKNPPLSRLDGRLRTVPFPTRRATFSEVKRIHDLLSTVEVYGSANIFQTSFPQSPKKARTVATNPEGSSGSPPAKRMAADAGSSGGGGSSSSERKGNRRLCVDRAKPRKSPHRPLPDIVVALARSSSESEPGREEAGLVEEEVEVDVGQELSQFGDSVHRSGKNRKCGKKKKKKAEMFSAPVRAMRLQIWTACTAGDTALLKRSLQAFPLEEEPSTTAEVERVPGEASTVTAEDLLKCLNDKMNDDGHTCLHVAAEGGHLEMIWVLLEAGSDPCIKNKKTLTPYVLSANKETRNVFRRFMAEFPDKYNYSKSQITSPLTDDMEQKMSEKRREFRKEKREKYREKRKVEEVKKAEEAEKERYLNLSDREKRALAAERRLLTQASSRGEKQPILARCFQCAADISGLTPFEYNANNFCTMACLKLHRQQKR